MPPRGERKEPTLGAPFDPAADSQDRMEARRRKGRVEPRVDGGADFGAGERMSPMARTGRGRMKDEAPRRKRRSRSLVGHLAYWSAVAGVWALIGGAGANGYSFHTDYLGRLPGDQNVYPPPRSALP